MNYTIIEDCSPFYIRYSWDGLSNLIQWCKDYHLPPRNNLGFRHLVTDAESSEKIISLAPMSQQMAINKKRVSFFLTEPGMYYGAHKDGLACHFSLNFTVTVLDDQCVTSWYRDEDLKDCEISTSYVPSLNITTKSPGSREVLNWDKTKYTPVKSMVAKPNEAILFNTEIFHDWDNSKSSNRRLVLTLRHETPAKYSFEDARQTLFGY